MRRTRIATAQILLVLFCGAQAVGAPLLVWSDAFDGQVRTANLDGSNVQVIVNGGVDGGVAVDESTGRVYWASSGTIRSAFLDGSDNNLILDTPSGNVWNMAIHNGQLFYNSSVPVLEGVFRMELDGTGLVRIGEDVGGEGLAVDHENEQVYYHRFGGVIKKVAMDGQSQPMDLSNPPTPGYFPGLFVDEVQDKLYYTSRVRATWAMYRSDLDGSNLDLVTNQLPGEPYSVYVDSPNNNIYWGSRDTGVIGRMDLDGLNQQTLITTSPDFYALTVTHFVIPEPTTLALAGLGLVCVARVRRRRLQPQYPLQQIYYLASCRVFVWSCNTRARR